MIGLGEADVVVVGPAPPLRGGIAAHTAGLVGHLRGEGADAIALSYRRLYPSLAFPGRAQRSAGEAPPWCHEDLDVLRPLAAGRAARALAGGRALAVLQWWHPVTAPVLLAAVAGLPPSRVVAVCHNAMPHEAFPAAAALARAVLRRCGRVVCHSPREADRVRSLLGGRGIEIVTAPLPCLVPAPELAVGSRRIPAEAEGRGARLFVAAGHLRAYKGTGLLLDAWQSARRPAGAALALVGEWYLHGRAARALRSRIAGDPSIVVVDRYVDDAELASWLILAEAVLAPHLDASQSGILPIAAALGVAAVVSDAGGLAAQAAPGAVVVRAGDGASLRAALERCFEAGRRVDLAARRAAASDSSARIHKEWQAVVEAIGAAARP